MEFVDTIHTDGIYNIVTDFSPGIPVVYLYVTNQFHIAEITCWIMVDEFFKQHARIESLVHC
jgi:hypothetical protein